MKSALLRELRERKNRGEIAPPISDAPSYGVPVAFWKTECSAIVEDASLVLIKVIRYPIQGSSEGLRLSYREHASMR